MFGSYSLVGQSWLNGVTGFGPDCPNGFICGPTGGNDPKQPPWNPPPPPPCPTDDCGGQGITIVLASCLGPITRFAPYGISNSAYLALLGEMLAERNENQAQCDEFPNHPPPSTGTKNDQLCQACPEGTTLVVNGSIPTGYQVVGNSFCIRAGVFGGATKAAANATASAALASTYAFLIAGMVIECSEAPPVVDCTDLPIIPDTPCDLGTADATVIGTATPVTTGNNLVTFSTAAGDYSITYLSGARNVLINCGFDSNNYDGYFITSDISGPITGYYSISKDNAGFDQNANLFFTTSYGYISDLSGAPPGCAPQSLAFFEGQVQADVGQPALVSHFGGNLSVAYKVDGVADGGGSAPDPSFQVIRIKKAVLDPVAQVRIVAADYAAILPVLVDADATSAAPSPWDGTFPTFQRLSLWNGWQWFASGFGTTTVNGKLIDTFTQTQHNVAAQPTPTGCAWICVVTLVGTTGVTWVGYGANGYSPVGEYVFNPDLNGFTISHELSDVIAATVVALPANTIVGVTLVADINGAIPAVDGVALILNDRILVKDEANAAKNGIYDVTQVGDGANPWILTRSADADTNAEVVQGIFVQCIGGSGNIGCYFRMVTTGPTVLGTTLLEWLRIPQVIEVESF